jgi:hypothetical protein
VRDANGDNRADGDAIRIVELPQSHHGGRALRRGPDGAMLLLIGSDAQLGSLAGVAGPRGEHPAEGGALLRLGTGSPASLAVLAHGFHRAGGFDVHPDGDLFTWDAGPREDAALPWHQAARFVHVRPGGHHGWRTPAPGRGWALPAQSLDGVEPLAPVPDANASLPSGLVCYRHRQFPADWQDGLFAADAGLGRVTFVGLDSGIGGFTARAGTFLEAVQPGSFIPVALAVEPDGSLIIAANGTSPAAGILRVEYVADPAAALLATNWMHLAGSDALAALDAPQPLEEWSRRLWLPLAERAGAEAFAALATDRRLTVPRRVRAIEILTELAGSLPPSLALACALAEAPEVRARVAWSAGLRPPANLVTVLEGLARDTDPYVRLAALESMRQQAGQLPPATLQNAVTLNLDAPNHRVRQAAALLATWLPAGEWTALSIRQKSASLTSRITWVLATQLRQPATPPGGDTNRIEAALSLLPLVRTSEDQLDVLRLLNHALGEVGSANPTNGIVEALAPYTPAAPVKNAAAAAAVERTVSPLVPNPDADVQTEATRALALVAAKAPGLPAKILASIGPRTAPSTDLHHLAILARLATPLPTNALERLAIALVSLDRKLAEFGPPPGTRWTPRLMEIAARLAEQNPGLGAALLRQPELVRPGNLALAPLLGEARRLATARLYFSAVQRTTGYPWSVQLIDLLAQLPPAEVHPLFRRHWTNPTLRDRLALELAPQPLIGDRPYFTASLLSTEPKVVRSCANALVRLPRDLSALVPTVRALHESLPRTEDRETRTALLGLLNHLTGQRFSAREDVLEPTVAYRHVFDWIAQRYPGVKTQAGF